ncbi:MAG: UDP-N-acetylmuramate--L-alanine ligase [Oligoflexus sp.]
MELSRHKPIYFLGIGGTGMAATAGLAQEAGYQVIGSDANLYPPMSTMLEELKIQVKTPYATSNLDGLDPQLVVVANALSRGHAELEEVIKRKIPYTSFPQFLGEHFLKKRSSVVISGTHGKTTTASLMAYALQSLGEDPGYMIGGIPRNFPRSFHLGEGPSFVIEGDEYDTAFFDKNSKFLHYHPQFLILNNLEFDHADIFPNLEAIEEQFQRLLSLVENKQQVLANIDDPGVLSLLDRLELNDKICRVSAYGRAPFDDASYRMHQLSFLSEGLWQIQLQTKLWGEFTLECKLAGPHNAANITQVIACLGQMSEAGVIRQPAPSELADIFRSFAGVARRMDLLGSVADVDVFEDFAHHPTAVAQVLRGMRTAYPQKRLLVAFEPKNATSRRNVFTKEFAQALSLADRIYIGPCPVDLRIPEGERMDTGQLVNQIGNQANAFATNEALLDRIVDDCQSGDAVVFMSSGSFSGVQHKIVKHLQDKLCRA